jgi:hypothetical protein
VAFQASLRTAFSSFIETLATECQGLLRHHLDIATSDYALAAIASVQATQAVPDDEFGIGDDLENIAPDGLAEDMAVDRTVDR